MFALTLLLFLCSLLVFASAPTGWLWVVALVVAEWGHYVALGALVLMALSVWRGFLGKITAALALLTALICL